MSRCYECGKDVTKLYMGKCLDCFNRAAEDREKKEMDEAHDLSNIYTGEKMSDAEVLYALRMSGKNEEYKFEG